MTAPEPQFDREILLARLTASRQWDRLLETATEWLAQEPEEPRAHLCRAEALINLDRRAEAEPHLAHALARNPHDAFAHRMMSMVQFDLKRYREADKSIHDALALNPEDPENWYHLAWMCYQQRDLKNGLKWARRALELAPGNSHILNLYALCAESEGSRPDLMEDVLALDPENAFAHNNLGVDYLDQGKFAEAEECFRRALTIDPTLKISRHNLFLAVKHRDLIYRILCGPRDFLIWFRNALLGDSKQKRNFGAAIVGFLVWIVVFRFVLVALIFWLGLVWPMLKCYEFLVIGDLRKKAGVVGATRGGPLGYRRWSLKTRLALFAAALVGFWTTLYFLIWAPARTEQQREDAAAIFVGIVLGGFGLYLLGKVFRRLVTQYHSWKRDRLLRKLNLSNQ